MHEKERQQLVLLEKKLDDLNAISQRESRSLNEAEKGLYTEIEKTIMEIRRQLPVDGPLTLQHGPLGQGPAYLRSTVSSEQATMPARGRDYRSMFGHSREERLDTGEFESCAEFLRVMDSGRYDPRLQKRASMGEGVPSSGGFSVPTAFASQWLDDSLPTEIVRNLCRLYPMTSESLEIPGWDGADMSAGATHGGLTMTFMAEGSTATPQVGKMRKVKLTAHMAGIYVDASIELVQDGKDFATNLETALQKSIGYGIDRFCLNGLGSGQPLGILQSACKIQVAGETGQRADTLVYSNLKNVFARQLNPDKAVWLFNSTLIPDLLEQSVAIGTGGSFVPLLKEGGKGEFSIFGRPVYFHPAMPSIGDADDAAFVDFNFYGLGLRSEVWVDMTDAVKWLQRERSFRILLRFDGMCTLNSAVTPEHGLSLSPVVTMAAR